MIIDCHTHLESYSDKQFDVKGLIGSMKKANIDKALVYAGEMFNCSNEQLLEAVAPYRKNLFPIGSISPLLKNKPSLDQVEKWLLAGEFYGLKFYTGYEHFYPADKIVRPYLRLLEKYKKPAVFHSGDTWEKAKGAKLKYAHPLNFDDLATDMPDLKIVIAHFGYPWVMDTAEVVSKNKNVYTDCSGLFYDKPTKIDKEIVKRAFEDYFYYVDSIDRLLFGTDWSLADQRLYVEMTSKMLTSDKDREKIFYRNAANLFLI